VCGFQPRNSSDLADFRGIRLAYVAIDPDGRICGSNEQQNATIPLPPAPLELDAWHAQLLQSWATWTSLELSRYCYRTVRLSGVCNELHQAIRVRDSVAAAVSAKVIVCDDYCIRCISETFDVTEKHPLPTNDPESATGDANGERHVGQQRPTSDLSYYQNDDDEEEEEQQHWYRQQDRDSERRKQLRHVVDLLAVRVATNDSDDTGPTRTLDQWYSWCHSHVVPLDAQQYVKNVEFFPESGLLRMCRYRHRECIEDPTSTETCFIGVEITSISNDIHHCSFDPQHQDDSGDGDAARSSERQDDGRHTDHQYQYQYQHQHHHHTLLSSSPTTTKQPVWLWILVAVSSTIAFVLLLAGLSLCVKRKLQKPRGNHPYDGFETLNPDEWS
jgi:hypothetical protein